MYATTDDGLRLPVVDVTSPAFAVSVTDAELATMSEQFVRESENRQELPPPVREALQRSMLGAALAAASGTFLAGIGTYLLKLAPTNLGDGFGEIDRRIAASFPAFATRVRLQDMANLLADGLAILLAANVARPLCLINIAGGTASDSWNALLQLRAEQTDALAGRAIAITVLDPDDRGPRFGALAVAALAASEGPLSGIAVGFRHVPYDWSQADRLGTLLARLGARSAACAISSEGGLFEYGSDAEITANLAQLHSGTPSDAFVVGSVTRDGAPARASQAASGVPTRPRTLDAFRSLASQSGWIVERVLERPFSFHVRLVKAGDQRDRSA